MQGLTDIFMKNIQFFITSYTLLQNTIQGINLLNTPISKIPAMTFPT